MHDDYEIVSGDKHIFIKERKNPDGTTDKLGTLNLTIEGNCNQLVKGDYTLEVEGDMYLSLIHI